MKKKYILHNVYNTLTGEYEDVEVSEELYVTYKRTGWGIENNDTSFYDHEIQLSGLIGGENDNYENFREFIDDVNVPENIFMTKLGMLEVQNAVNDLSAKEKDLIVAIYYERLTESEYADRICVTQQYVSKSKKKILKKLKLFLKKRL